MGTFSTNTSPLDMVKKLAKNALEKQKPRTTDVFQSDGQILCGRCGEYRRKIKMFKDPTETDPNHMSPILVAIPCKCDVAEDKRLAVEELNKKAMQRLNQLRAASLIDERFRDARFTAFELNKYNARNLQICQRYVAVFDKMLESNQGLLMWGNVGTGKSFSAACIANELLNKHVPVAMTSFVKLVEVIENRTEEAQTIINRLNSAKLVIFDDLGAERGSDYTLEKVYNIVDSRYRRKLPMIVTTNLTMEEMKKEQDTRYSRIYDRLFESCYPIQFTGPSWRRKTAAKRFHEVSALLEGDWKAGG